MFINNFLLDLENFINKIKMQFFKENKIRFQ
jgi:hypothetical protein